MSATAEGSTGTALEIHTEADAPSNTALVVIDEAQTKLASITTIEEAKQWHSELVAIQHFLRCQRSGLAMQNKAALYRFRIERRMGELLRAVPKVQGKRAEPDGLLLTIKRSGFSQWAAFRWMNLAQVPESELLQAASSCDAEGEELTSSLVYEVYVRRWMARQSDTKQEQTTASGEMTLLEAKRELEELKLLATGALAGLSDLEARTIITELREAYEHYCNDAARGKVPAWGDEPPPPKTVQAQFAKHPSKWKTAEGWYPPYTVDRQCLRYLTEEIIADLRAGIGDGHRGIARQFNLANRLKGRVSEHGAHDALGRLMPCIEEVKRSALSTPPDPSRHVLVEATIRWAIRELNNLSADSKGYHLEQ